MRTYRRGFSLIELLVTLCVACTLLSVSWPIARDWIEREELRTGIRAITSTLHMARQQAVQSGRTVTVNTGDGNWHTGWTLQTQGETEPSLIGNRLGKSLFSYSASTVSKAILYRSDGTAKHPSGAFQAGTIYLCNNAGHRGSAIILAPSGRVRVESMSPCKKLPQHASTQP
ncbi:GspH/FimT family pseudopilin [Pseudomonas sp. UBA2684]|uniref:GspH/FimT family pseudopilin n=1 Tax=Pseudomonas sp. UBA2684 TaxID=1947311 RepID=UPI0039C8CCC8